MPDDNLNNRITRIEEKLDCIQVTLATMQAHASRGAPGDAPECKRHEIYMADCEARLRRLEHWRSFSGGVTAAAGALGGVVSGAFVAVISYFLNR